MSDLILLGRGDKFHRIPHSLWEKHFEEAPDHSRQRLAFMSGEHHLVRNFVVREMPKIGYAIPPSLISDSLELAPSRVAVILDDLEENLTFLSRNSAGEVAWAYPVTVDKTPHRIRFTSGEQLYGA